MSARHLRDLLTSIGETARTYSQTKVGYRRTEALRLILAVANDRLLDAEKTAAYAEGDPS